MYRPTFSSSSCPVWKAREEPHLLIVISTTEVSTLLALKYMLVLPISNIPAPVMISAQPGGEPAGLPTWANLIPTGYQPGPRTKPKLIIWFPQFFIILHSLQLIFPRCLDILPCQCELQFGLRHHHCCLFDDVRCLPSKLKQEVQLLALPWRNVCGGLSCSSAVVPLVDSCFILVLSLISSSVLSHGQIF